MKNFKEITDLPVYDLTNELNQLLSSGAIDWSGSQICINTVPGKEDDFRFGCGSLILDWDNSYWDEDQDKQVVPKREIPMRDEDFTVVATPFLGTLFEDAYRALDERYELGRVRLMLSTPKTCMSWHYDFTPRFHFPIKTQEGCMMVIEDELMHLEQNKWWLTDTVKMHTAFNASMEERIHLVVVILGEK